ncbi:alpha/beta hydrolase-fold protein [Ferruginibacter paludis]|uniref:alpha/beta hydrolase n=1 Tax=Ferruginibacter paludis TaxID=1310417 RepID=UPI0025B44FF3|nr:alpha/beta hydrolase-fold protein [Ferruginibacter paludis]MDN3657451.1 alpha/beta hydrolase-fold protein [Ferruginibacter paludis]
MKKILAILLSFAFMGVAAAQRISGTIVTSVIHSTYLQNTGGENIDRRISVYLPPGYAQAKQHYPVIYYLHGFLGTDSITPNMKNILDMGIAKNKIRPFILVIADHFTLYSGSFYSNSALTGNWSDFEAKELVSYMDKNFKTIANRNARGIGGHSMGGYGALKIAMLYPDVFGSVYALSPGLLAFVKEFGPNSDSYKQLAAIKTKDELDKTYYPKVIAACARAWSPNANKPPFYIDLPFNYVGDSLVVDSIVYQKWRSNMPLYMIDSYSSNLKKLKAIQLDWGRNDASRFPVQCGMFSQELENHGIEHYAEEYIGTHTNKIWTTDGRVLNDLLPFFNDYLQFEEH